MAKHRGITAATRKMPYGIQQPAISGQLGQLEKTLGTRLFHRRPFGLTPAGAKLFGEIEAFFGRLHDLPHQVCDHATRRLRLAAPATVLRGYLPKIFVEYKRRDRNFQLSLYEANQASAEELLRKREIDVAITELEGRSASSVNSSVLLRLPLVLVAPQRSAFRKLRDFFDGGSPAQSLISLRGEEVIPKHFHAGLSKLGLSWTPSIEVSSLELIDLYTALGFGAGLSVAVPALKRHSGLRVLPLPKCAPVTIAALWSGELTGPAATFLADVKKLADQLSS